MPEFIFVYHGGTAPASEEDAAREMALWEAWFAELGDAVVIPGNPAGKSKTVSAAGIEDHGGPNPISGYTVVSGADIDAATAMASSCPLVKDGSGSVEVAPIIDM